MATNLTKKKKKGSYDNKLIMWISIGLGAVVALIVIVALIISFSTGYVAKVDGVRIDDYVYKYYLQTALSKEYSENFEKPDNYDELSDDEVKALEDAFWTEERKSSCTESALDEARKFAAMYKLAVDKGYKPDSTQRASIKSTTDYYYNYMMQSGQYSKETVLFYYFNNMTLSQYKDYAIMQAAIENYKVALKKNYAPTDAELREIYDKAPDDYRLISLRYMQINKPTAVSVPKDDSGNEIPADTTDEALKTKYNEYLTKLEEYNKTVAESKTWAEEIVEALNTTGKYSMYEKDENGEIVKDDSGNPKYKYEDADFTKLITGESDSTTSSSDGGLKVVNAQTEFGTDEIDEYALSLQWGPDKKSIIEVPKPATTAASTEGTASTSTAQVDKENPIYTQLKIIETDTAFYIIRCEGIEDFENSVESSEGAKDSIKDNINTQKLEELAVAELEKMVADAGSRFAIESRKDDVIKEIMDVFM